MPITFVGHNISRLTVDAIISITPPRFQIGEREHGSISHSLGAALIPFEVKSAPTIPEFDLAAKYIIQTMWSFSPAPAPDRSRQLLYDAYRNALTIANNHDLASVAIPVVSGQVFGFPLPAALDVATTAVADHLRDGELDVFLVVLEKEAFATNRDLLEQVSRFIDNNYNPLHIESILPLSRFSAKSAPGYQQNRIPKIGGPFDNVELDDSFSEALRKAMKDSGLKFTEIHERANISKAYLSKVSNGAKPGKRAALALAIALGFNLDEIIDFISKAGYVLTHAELFDVIVEDCIRKGVCNVVKINQILYQYGQPQLGGSAAQQPD